MANAAQHEPIDLSHSPEHPLPISLTEHAPQPRMQSVVVPVRQTRSMTRRGGGRSSTVQLAGLSGSQETDASPQSIAALSPAGSGSLSASNSLSPAPARPPRKRARVERTPEELPAEASGSSREPAAPSAPPPTDTSETATLLGDAITCPVCMCPPSDAAITPCGHILCGECLFGSVAAGIHRQRQAFQRNPEPQCPVCRARIDGWDGQGGGVVGLRLRTADAL